MAAVSAGTALAWTSPIAQQLNATTELAVTDDESKYADQQVTKRSYQWRKLHLAISLNSFNHDIHLLSTQIYMEPAIT